MVKTLADLACEWRKACAQALSLISRWLLCLWLWGLQISQNQRTFSEKTGEIYLNLWTINFVVVFKCAETGPLVSIVKIRVFAIKHKLKGKWSLISQLSKVNIS